MIWRNTQIIGKLTCSGILNEVTIDSFVPFLLYGRLLQRHALGSRRVSSCV